MKKLSLYGLIIGIAFFAGAVSTSCDTVDAEIDAEVTAGQPVIELTFDTGMGTRAGESDYPLSEDKEQVMSTVDIFFYPTDDTEGTAVKTVSLTNTKHDTHHTISLSDEDFFALFGSRDKTKEASCVVYAVVNVSDEDFTAASVNKQSATLADLQKIKATTPDFAAVFQGGCLAMFSKNKSGDAVTYKPSEKKASGKINLQNLAAKIDLLVNFEADVKGVNPNGDKNTETQTWNVATSNATPTAEVHILNGVQAVVLGGFDKEALTEEDYYSIRYNDQYTRGVEALDSGDKDYNYNKKTWYVTSAPYYSYPNEWEDNPMEKHGTSLLLKVDWTTLDNPEEAGDNDVLTTYYNVPLALDANRLESNKYYRVKVNINTLGGQNFGEPLEIEAASVEVLDWGHAELEADIRELRYLAVSQTQKDRDAKEYTAVINGNKGLVTIPFRSSHKAVIKSVKITYTSYVDYTSTGGGRDEDISDAGQSKSPDIIATIFTKSYDDLMNNDWHGAYIDNVNHTITVKHNIGATKPNNTNNPSYYEPDISEQYMYYSYYITIELRHEDLPDLDFADDDLITIVHHPAIYVAGEVNDNYNTTWNFLAGADASHDRSADVSILSAARLYGWTRVNNNSYNNASYGGLSGLQKTRDLGDIVSTRSDNPVMYIVTATQIDGPLKVGDKEIEFHIRDPRVTQSNTLQTSGWTAAPHYRNGQWVQNAQGQDNYVLEYYYPTDGSPMPEIMNAISPRYRMASSFGNPSNSITSLEDAQKRCASYCEAGYPAGRWRLPTYGEMAFVSYLSKEQLIPPLFGGRVLLWRIDAAYWNAQGLYKVDDDGNINPASNSGTRYVRCVYDDWYWVKDDGTPDKIDDPYNARSDHQIFVWGDKPKNNPQEQPQND